MLRDICGRLHINTDPVLSSSNAAMSMAGHRLPPCFTFLNSQKGKKGNIEKEGGPDVLICRLG